MGKYLDSSGITHLWSKMKAYVVGLGYYTIPSTGIPASDIASGVIPSAPGTLNTTATTAQSTSSSEVLSGSITLHKVAKTGTYSDLIGKPTIPTVPEISTDIISDGIDDTKTASPKAVKTFVEGKGYLTSETEPDFNSSTAASITSADITAWNGKQDALVFNTAYNASSNKVATMSDIPTVPSNIVTGTSSSYTIWVGTQSQYEAISTKNATTIYLITES